MDVTTLQIVLLSAAAFFAGFVDAIAGGGGLIQLPALLLAFPGAPVASLLGTNKLSSIAGTSIATAKYLRAVKLDLRLLVPAAAVAFLASGAGAVAVSYADPQKIKPAIAMLLAGVLVFTVAKRDFGTPHADRSTIKRPMTKVLLLAGIVGFYDGFLGPGTGGFLVFGFVGLLGMNFLEGGASAKVLNLATNVAAVAFFASKGLVIYELGIPMAICNVLGSYAGSHLAIAKGSTFIRKVFVVVVGLVLLRLIYDIVVN